MHDRVTIPTDAIVLDAPLGGAMPSQPGQLFATDPEFPTIRATITRVMYCENGTTIAKVMMDRSSPAGKDVRVDSVIGPMLEPLVGQLYEFSGIVEWNEKYRTHQMRFESYRTILPTDRDGIASYLIDTAKWVGPSHAKALLDAFGTDTLHVLKDEPARVEKLAIPGLTGERIAQMQESLLANEKIEAATIEVNNLLGGVVPPAVAKKAIRRWKGDAATVIKENPFALTELPGIGWATADAIWKRLGLPEDGLFRHVAALQYILSEAAREHGHTICSSVYVDAESCKLLGPRGLRPEVVTLCTQDESVECDGIQYSLGSIAKAEKYVANKIVAMLTRARDSHRQYPEIDTAGLAPDQVDAVQALQLAPVGILTGAPGTGKTYTTARFVQSFVRAGLSVRLCAPTGKAAKQMSLALAKVGGGDAMTIHSLLEPTKDEEGSFVFGRNAMNPIDCDVLVIDEFSMVDIRLAQSLLRAVRETTRVLIVGDHYQLPSVGPGAVLRDLLRAGVPSFELKQIKRNAGRIVRACHSLKDGGIPGPSMRLDLAAEEPENWKHIDAGKAEEIKEVIGKLITENLPSWPEKFGVHPMWGWQIISPVNDKGPLCVDRLNELAKQIVNDRPKEEKLEFGIGDKVVRLRNGLVIGEPVREGKAANWKSVQRMKTEDGTVRVVNGDIGQVLAVDEKSVYAHLKYPDRVVKLPRKDHSLRMAYCMTCHKMQGSEVDVVILPLHMSLAKVPMVNREWIYTAMSRAKKFILTVGDLAAIGPMVARVGNTKRQTVLASVVEKCMSVRIGGNGKAEQEVDL